MTQQMVDQVFSFGELGFQEFETSKYLTGILRENGFTVTTNVAGIPTAWTARWGSGKPVIALGSDIDDIPQASQKPGVAYHDPLIVGAPGHGEGHNSGLPLQITAALAVKRIMERERLPGTLLIWPGVAEELLAGKAYFVRAGVFKDVDICLFAHVSDGLSVRWGEPGNATGLVSVEYAFTGESAHAASGPWRGRSALDAVELMNIGWNFRREHLRLQQRSHYVVTDGGDQPNVVPQNASVWYFLRETDYPHIKEMREIADQMASGAALMTHTRVTSRVLGSAWPQHFNKVVAETMYSNITAVGLPAWDEPDVTLAKALQKELGQPERGLTTEIGKLEGPVSPEDNRGGGSDDIGDVSWNVPTVTLRYPSNIPGLPGHNWANAIASATPIAHKGATTGATVIATTTLDFLMQPALVSQAWDYFRNTQTKNLKYVPLIGVDDHPVTSLNAATMAQYREEMRKYYYDPTKYTTYLEQLGIKYPTVRAEGSQTR
jgi:aminobenzoyl-glutamate utilization protein B